MSRAYAFLLSMYLLVEGVCELMARDLVFGVFTTNTLHAVVHLVVGMIGLFLGAPRNPRAFNSSVGALLLIVGILFFIPRIGGWLISLFNMNKTWPISISCWVCSRCSCRRRSIKRPWWCVLMTT